MQQADPVALGLGVVVLLAMLDPAGQQDGFAADAAAVDCAFAGSFSDAVAARAGALPSVLVVLGLLNWAFALGSFLLGLVAGRRGILRHPATPPPIPGCGVVCSSGPPPSGSRPASSQRHFR